jgi:hypothetical protein
MPGRSRHYAPGPSLPSGCFGQRWEGAGAPSMATCLDTVARNVAASRRRLSPGALRAGEFFPTYVAAKLRQLVAAVKNHSPYTAPMAPSHKGWCPQRRVSAMPSGQLSPRPDEQSPGTRLRPLSSSGRGRWRRRRRSERAIPAGPRILGRAEATAPTARRARSRSSCTCTCRMRRHCRLVRGLPSNPPSPRVAARYPRTDAETLPRLDLVARADRIASASTCPGPPRAANADAASSKTVGRGFESLRPCRLNRAVFRVAKPPREFPDGGTAFRSRPLRIA